MADLRQQYAAVGEKEGFEALQGFLTREAGQEPYKALATRLNLTENAVKMRVRRLRLRFGMLLREQIADTVADGKDEKAIDDEMHYLFAVWS